MWCDAWDQHSLCLGPVSATLFPCNGPGVEERQRDECADLNNTTWLEYQQQRVKVQVQYLLLTRRNVDCAQMFTQQTLTDTQQPSYLNTSLPTKVIIHGYRWGEDRQRPPRISPIMSLDRFLYLCFCLCDPNWFEVSGAHPPIRIQSQLTCCLVALSQI